MTILKSRTPILKLEAPAAAFIPTKLRKKIARGDALPPKKLGRLTFDIARTLEKSRAADEEGARRFLAEQIVMGHFKLRQIRNRDEAGNIVPGHTHQLIWWNPHWRGGTDEQKMAHAGLPPVKERDGVVVDKHPSSPKVIPFANIVYGNNVRLES